MSGIDCLFVFGDEACQVKLNKGSSHDELVVKFQKTFHHQGISVIQEWNADWNAWVNIGKDYVAEKTKNKFRGLSPQKFGILSPDSSVVFCCDMQERFEPAISYFGEIAENGNRILKASQILDIPLVVTEQYPKGLGKTVQKLDISHASLTVDKTRFSMLTPRVSNYLEDHSCIKSVVLFGVEAHVCVQQTAIELMSQGYDVHIVADATSSRELTNRFFAFERLAKSGAFMTTCETVLLQWVADKNHKNFKEIQGLIKISPPSSGLLSRSKI